MRSQRSSTLMTAVLLAFSLGACGDDPVTPPPPPIDPLPATQIAISAPSTAVVGDYLNSLTVELRDVNGSVVSGATDMVTIAMTTDPSGVALLWGTTTVAAVAGVATFDDISIDTPGTGFAFTASSGTFAASISGLVDLTTQFTTAANLTGMGACDDCTEEAPIGFTFSFYGTDYTTAWINTNGTINLGAGCNRYINEPIPTAGGQCDSMIAPYWDDLYPPTAGDVYFETFGTAPNRTFVVEWRGVPHITEQATSSLQFNVIVYEGSGEVEFEYGAMDATTTPSLATGGTATIGFEDQTGAAGLEFSFNTADAIVDGREMRFAFVNGSFARVR